MSNLPAQVAALHDGLRAANEHLRSLGWYPFGYTANLGDVELEFSKVTTEDGSPAYERIRPWAEVDLDGYIEAINQAAIKMAEMAPIGFVCKDGLTETS